MPAVHKIDTDPADKDADRLACGTFASYPDGPPLCIAFTLAALEDFTFDGMFHRGDRAGGKGGHATLTRLGNREDHLMRVHLYLHDHPGVTKLDDYCRHPIDALKSILPGLQRELPAVERIGPVELLLNDAHTRFAPWSHSERMARVRGYLGRGLPRDDPTSGSSASYG